MVRLWIAVLFLLTPALSGVASASPGHAHAHAPAPHAVADAAEVAAGCEGHDCGQVHGTHCSSGAGGHCVTVGIWSESGAPLHAPGALPGRFAPGSDPARPTREMSADPPPPRS